MTRLRPRPLAARPTVSVVIPCYNYGRYLEECVDSALRQEGVAVDVVIIDDASRDGSAETARDLSRRHANVRAVVHDVNLGHIATYNEGLSQVTGDLILLLSADDLLAPGALKRAAAVFEHHPRVGLVYGFSPSFDANPPPFRSFAVRWTIWSGSGWVAAVSRSGRNPVATPSAVMRRDAFSAVGGYDDRFPHAADLMMWLRVAAEWDVAHVEGADQAFYRSHPQSMHATRYAGVLADLNERKSVFDAFFSEHGAGIDHSRHSQARVSQALARQGLHALAAARAAGADQQTLDALGSLQARLTNSDADRLVPATTRSSFTGVAKTHVMDRFGWHVWRRFGVYP